MEREKYEFIDIKEIHNPLFFFVKKMDDQIKMQIKRLGSDAKYFEWLYGISQDDWLESMKYQLNNPYGVWWLSIMSDALDMDNDDLASYYKRLMCI